MLIPSIGFAAAFSCWMNAQPAAGLADLAPAALAGLAGALGLSLLRRLVLGGARRLPLSPLYARFDAWCYLPFLVFVLGAFGVRFPVPFTLVALAAVFSLFQGALLFLALDRESSSAGWLAFPFLLSGFAASIYQVVWQRALFTAYGVNVESITVTVSIFMLGLGLGSLAGGLLSRLWPERAVGLFCACELGIGAFGLVSLPLIRAVSAATLHASTWGVSLAVFALLLLPTLAMGATLPLLVEHVNRRMANVGRSVGLLYGINTLGSAAAAVFTVDVLFALAGQQAAAAVAALCNFAVAATVVLGRPAHTAAPAAEPAADRGQSPPPFILTLLLAGATGYLSLSQEILWTRAASYLSGGSPRVFAYVLAAVLLGLAAGAYAAMRHSARGAASSPRFIAASLVACGVTFEFSLPLVAWLLERWPGLGTAVLGVAPIATAALAGAVFPVLCHHAIRGGSATGLRVSFVYLANILGSTAGPLLTGFYLLDWFTLEVNVLLNSAALAALGAAVALAHRERLLASAALGAALAFTSFHGRLHSSLLERLHFKSDLSSTYETVIQNRSGIIAVLAGHPAALTGGGVPDGWFNIDPARGSQPERHWSLRPYTVAALHPEPREILQIGLGSGSWTRVLASHAAVRRLVAVEINPGYLELIRTYPDVAPILSDPKVSIAIDDGRRWLARHPGEKFDVIVSNTTYHWRAHVTGLLSVEFLRLCKARLKDRGVLFLGTTGSLEAIRAASTVFRHVVRFHTLIGASDWPFDMSVDRRRENVAKFALPGPDLSGFELLDVAQEFRARTDLTIVTDDNMATEFRRRQRFHGSGYRWGPELLFGQ